MHSDFIQENNFELFHKVIGVNTVGSGSRPPDFGLGSWTGLGIFAQKACWKVVFFKKKRKLANF